MNIATRNTGKAAAMRLLLLVVCALIVAAAVAPTSALADSRSYNHLHANIKKAFDSANYFYMHRNTVKVIVYGPSYYKEQIVYGSCDAKDDTSVIFPYIPRGAYRVRYLIWDDYASPTTMARWGALRDVSEYPSFSWSTIGNSISCSRTTWW